MAKDSKRYAELAQYGNDHGYAELKPDTVQYWTRRGLVPHADTQHVDFGVRVTTESIWTGRLVLRACHYRYDWRIRDIAQVGTLVWIDHLPVADKLVRAGLLIYADLPVRLLELVSRNTNLVDTPLSEVIDEAAIKVAYHPRLAGSPLLAGPAVPRPDRAAGFADLLRVLILGQATKTEELGKLGAPFGLGSDQFADGIVRIGKSLSPAALSDRIAAASTEELDTARDRAQAMLGPTGDASPPLRLVSVVSCLGIGAQVHSG